MLRLSNNLIIKSKKENILFYNSLFGGLSIIKPDLYKQITSPSGFDKIPVKTINLLKSNGFIFDDIECEINKTIDNDSSADIRKRLLRVLRLNVATCCNLSCIYCYIDNSYDQKNNEIMKFKTAKKSIDCFEKIICNYNTKNYEIRFFGGEPLLNYRLIEKIVNYSTWCKKWVLKNV
jgi:sulfatase maturation enzyme AslB (radical SAM superfamily)